MRRKYNSWMVIGLIILLLLGYTYIVGQKQTNSIEAKAYYNQANNNTVTTTSIVNQQDTSTVKPPTLTVKGKKAGDFEVRLLDQHGNPVDGRWRKAYILPSQSVYLYSGRLRIEGVNYRLYLDSDKIPEPYHFEITVYATIDNSLFYQKHYSGDYNSWIDLLLEDNVYLNNNLGAISIGRHTMKLWAIGTITHGDTQYSFHTDIVYLHLEAKAPQSIIPIDGGIYNG